VEHRRTRKAVSLLFPLALTGHDVVTPPHLVLRAGVELLRELAPGIKRVAMMFNPDTAPIVNSMVMPVFETAAKSFNICEDNFGRSARYVDSILRGSKPSELPVQMPVKYLLIINLKTAKAVGITVPEALLFVYQDSVGVLAALRHPLVRRRRVLWRELATENWVLPRPGHDARRLGTVRRLK
jgi:ABC-type uncharacterized transport system substrate-binding protein